MKFNKRKRRSKIIDFNTFKTGQFQEMLIFIGVVILIVSVMIFYVWERIAIYKTVYSINRLKNMVSELSKANKDLEIEYYRLANYSRIEKIAKSHLGLVDSDNMQVILVAEKEETKDRPMVAEHIEAYDRRRSIISRIIEMSKAYAK